MLLPLGLRTVTCPSGDHDPSRFFLKITHGSWGDVDGDGDGWLEVWAKPETGIASIRHIRDVTMRAVFIKLALTARLLSVNSSAYEAAPSRKKD